MSGYTIKKVETKKQLEQFVRFPFSLFKGNPYWVPPIISEEVELLSPEKNPAFLTSDASFFLAYNSDNKIVGRVAVIVNKTEVFQQGVKKVRFGWLDMIDDIQVTRILLEKVREIGLSYHLDYMEGPQGFSNMDKVGVVIEGFDQLGTMVTWNSFPYYKEHLEKLGFSVEKTFVEKYFLVDNVDYRLFHKTAQLVKERYGLKEVELKKNADILQYADKMFDLFNRSYSALPTFMPIDQRQKEYFKKKYIPFLNVEYVKFIVDAKGDLVCFAIVLPSFSKALQKANGKIFPLGFFHLLRAKKKNDTVDFYLIGVSPEYQSKGVPAVLFDLYYPIFQKNKVKKCVITPELESNQAVQRLWKNFQPVDHIRRATYRREV